MTSPIFHVSKRVLSTGKLNKRLITEKLKKLHENISKQSKYHLGYPYNLNQNNGDLRPFMDFFLNNLGDAYAQSNYKINTQELEREVIEIFINMWGGNKQILKSTDLSESESESEPPEQPNEPIWGAITSCGTEGNLLGILYGREACESTGSPVTLISSTESHYSISKACRMYKIPYIQIKSQIQNGEIDYNELEMKIKNIILKQGGSIIIVVNVGSTVIGAHDNLNKIINILKNNKIPKSKYYIHIDAALSGLLLPLIHEAKSYHFGFDLGADSIAVSGHKQLGTPIPCGVICTKKQHMERWAAGTPSEADYVNTQDSTISGSRSGFAALALWYALQTQGTDGLELDARICIAKAEYLRSRLEHQCGSKSNPIRYNPFSTTVVFKRPSQKIELKYQLATTRDIAHIVVTPSVSKQLLDEFVDEYEEDVMNQIEK